MKVLGIYPQGAYAPTGGDPEWLEPLGLEYILGQAALLGHDVEFLTMYDMSEAEMLAAAIGWQPNVVALSAMTCQINRASRVASAIKSALPASKIVLGGYHPSAIKEVPAEVDYVVVGEGEMAFREILNAIETGQSIGPVVQRRREDGLDGYGFAWRPIELVKRLKNYGLAYPAPSQQTGCVTLEFSRGCKGNCPFCSSPGALGCFVTFRSADAVCFEIETLYRQHGINTFFFCDLDFIQQGEANQARVEELCRKLIALNLPVYWECMGRIKSVTDTGNYKLLGLMYQAGCRKIGWGIESLDPKIAKSMGKGHHGLEGNETWRVLHAAEEVGILNTGFLIIGWHDFEGGVGDCKEAILSDLAWMLNYPLHRIRIGMGTPLPGSRFYRICVESGLLTESDWEKYDTNHLVYRHPRFSAEELEKLRSQIYRRFYSSREYKQRVKWMLKAHPEYKQLFEEFLQGVHARGYA